ncbi:MAG: cell wall-binding repeat-containing protein [Actinobacteria bacterium]|nr:cell wall-binding repeat-containing protein [Actinomycetota bacterium]
MTTLTSRSAGRRGVIARITRPFAFLLLTLGLIAGSELSAAIATEFLSAQEAELARLLNGERVSRGLPVLSHADALRTVARRHAQRMMIEGQIFHNERLREDVEAVFPAWASIGENVGVGPTIPSVHRAFMDSPGHRANILDPDWGWMGVGVVTGGSRLFMTENFLTLQPGAPRPSPAQFRLAGATRTGTARAVSDFGFTPGTAGGAVLADAFDFHGALAGAALAGQVSGPVVLSATDRLDPDARDALVRALGANSGKTVYLVGGPFADAVASGIEGLGLSVATIGGADHIAMATELAAALPQRPRRAFIATVANYPDALAASAVAAATGDPILYSDPDRLDSEVEATLSQLGVREVILVGGPEAVSSTVEQQLGSAGLATSRLGGADRIATSLVIADFGMSNGLRSDHIQIATGFNFPDALAGGGLAPVLGSPVVLTNSERLAPAAAAWIRARATQVDAVYLLGGPAALSAQVEVGLADALR